MGPAKPALVTAEQALDWPDPDARFELVAGVVQPMTPAGGPHGVVNMHLARLLGGHVHAHRLGLLFSPDTGFVLRRGPDTVRCPDVALVAADRLSPEGVRRGFPELAPDLAVEVRSPFDRTRASWAKVAEYLGFGVREVWTIDPDARTVTVHRPDGATRRLGEDDVLDGGDVVPGFRCAVAELFEGVARE